MKDNFKIINKMDSADKFITMEIIILECGKMGKDMVWENIYIKMANIYKDIFIIISFRIKILSIINRYE
jgi:hypothetical protein